MHQSLGVGWRNRWLFVFMLFRKVDILSMTCMYIYTQVQAKRNSLCQLPRSGWPVGRAGLGATATYPA